MIAIIGDSFSYPWSENTWVSRISEEFNVAICACGGWSNLDMWKAVKSGMPNDIKAIINYSHLYRGPIKMKLKYSGLDHDKLGVKEIADINLKCCDKLMNYFEDSYIWTPFHHYSKRSEVDFIPLYPYNDLYNTKLTQLDGHFTQKGHDIMYARIKKVIERMNNE